MVKLFYARSCILLAVTATLAACGGSSGDNDKNNDGTGSTSTALITTQVTGQGTITPSSLEIPISSSTTLQVAASENHQLDSISGCNGEINALQNQYAISNISGNCTVSAVFIEKDDNGGGVVYSDNHTVGRADMTISAYLVQDALSQLDITINTENPHGRSGSFSLDLSGLNDNDWVLVEASGGTQLDPLYTGEYEAGYATPDAKLYAFAQVKDWNDGANISLLTDITWRLIEPYIGHLPFEEALIRLDELTKSLSARDDWSYRDILTWSMHDRAQVASGELNRYDSVQFSVDGRATSNPDVSGGYAYFVDNGYDANIIGQKASHIAGPSISYVAPATGKKYSRIEVTVLGPGSLESDIPEFNLEPFSDVGIAFVERGLARNSVTAVEKPGDNVGFVRWINCPNIVDVLTCEFSGTQSRQIRAIFEFTENRYTDGYVEIGSDARFERHNQNTLIFDVESLTASDIEKLESLQHGGYIGHFSSRDFVFARALGMAELQDGNIIVTIEDVPWEEILLHGTIRAIAGAPVYEFEDEQGQLIYKQAGDTFDLDGYRVTIKEGGFIGYEDLKNPSRQDRRITFGAATFDFGFHLNADLEEAAFHVLPPTLSRPNVAANFTLISSVTAELKTGVKLNPTVRFRYSYPHMPTIRVPAPFLAGVMIRAKPDLIAEAELGMDDIIGIEYNNFRTYRVGASVNIPMIGLPFGHKPMLINEWGIVDAPGAMFTSDTDPLSLEGKGSAEVSANLGLAVDLGPATFISVDLGAGIYGYVKATNDPEEACVDIEGSANAFAEARGRIGFSLFQDRQFTGSLSRLRELHEPIVIGSAGARLSWDIPGLRFEGGFDLSDDDSCNKEALTIHEHDLHKGTDYIYSVGYNPIEQEFRIKILNPDGEWSSWMQWQPTLGVLLDNDSEFDSVLVTAKLEASHHPDGFNPEDDRLLDFEFEPLFGTEGLKKVGPSEYRGEISKGEGLMAKWGLRKQYGSPIDTFEANALMNQTFEYLITITGETERSKQVREYPISLRYVELPNLQPAHKMRYNFYAGGALVQLALRYPNFELPLEGLWATDMLQYLEINSLNPNYQIMTDTIWLSTPDEGETVAVLTFLVGFSVDNFFDELPIRVRHGFSNGRVLHDYAVRLPGCILDDDLGYDCSARREGWVSR